MRELCPAVVEKPGLERLMGAANGLVTGIVSKN
ncbi:hypothetical protein ES708_20192 [subsurface metagenome]